MKKGPMMRIRENPALRVIPVIDGEGETKCSFDARSDREMGRFRQTVCTKDNVLGVTTFDDVLCTQKSEMPAAMPLIFRGMCTELPTPQKRGMEGKDGEKKEGDDKGRGPGRRLMDKEDMKGKGKGEKMGEGKDDE